MTEEQILDGNKLIAEFMGAKYDKDTSFPIHPDDLWLPIHGICNFKTIKIGKGKILLYHKSWDWLMPVVEKIENLKFEYSYYKGRAIITDLGFQNMMNDIAFSGSRIEATWLAVVEFIKWYNQNK